MTFLPLSEHEYARRPSAGRPSAVACAHIGIQIDHLSGLRFLLPLGRESAVSLPRANSRECCARARLSGLYFFNASNQPCRQALRQLLRVRIHNSDPLRLLAGFDASQPSERVIHEVGQVLRVLGQIIRGGND